MSETQGRATPPAEIVHAPLDDFDLFVNQSREHFDQSSLQALADNIRQNGQLQPGVAVHDPGRNRLVLVCGERRYRAIKLAGLPTMAVTVIRGPKTPGQMLALNLAENLQRASLNPIERAKGFHRLMQLEDLNASEVAARMNVSNATVSNSLALLELSEPLQARIAAGLLPASVGAHIARVADSETRRALADQYEGGQINREGVAREVKQIVKSSRKKIERLARLTVKLSGIAVSLSGPPDKLNTATLPAVLDTIGRAARSLHDGGKADIAMLARVLKAS